MKVNGESIYGSNASPFKYLEWGRCTQQAIAGGTRLYLHVFDWPETGELVVPGIYNGAKEACLLSDPEKASLEVTRREDAIVITIPEAAPDSINSVVVLDIEGKTDISNPPEITADFNIFVDDIKVTLVSDRENVQVRYTQDGTIPQADSPLAEAPVRLIETTNVSARCFRDGKPVSGTTQATFTRVSPTPAKQIENPLPGIRFAYFEGDWDWLPDFDKLNPVKTSVLPNFNFSPRNQEEHFGFQYTGFIKIPKDGVYGFSTDSDDGSQLFIGDQMVVNNDGLHGMQEKAGVIALATGFHPIRVTFFEKMGGDGLKVYWKGVGMEKDILPDGVLFFE
jgi:alpha-L-fucosidase